MRKDSSGILKNAVLIVSLFLLLLGFLVSGSSAESSRTGTTTFRCGNDLVSLGDSMADVVLRCGEPTHRYATGARGKAKTIKRKSGDSSQKDPYHEGSPRKRKSAANRMEYEEQVTETWYYNRGPNDFVYRLAFEGGTLKKINQGKRGK